MNILCDTHVLLWFLDGQNRRFPAETLGLLMDEGNTLHYSDASIWEIAIKFKQKRPDFPYDPQHTVDALNDQEFLQVPIRLRHILETMKLPAVHGDPFDRLLLAQARADGFLLLTADRRILQYQDVLVRAV